MLNSEMISSEESGDEDVIIIKPLPWRSSRVTEFFRKMDEKTIEQRSQQAKRQTKSRVLGEASLRPKPAHPLSPAWAFMD